MVAGRVLVIGYGNPGRLDDGLGPALARMIEERKLPGVTVDADYQLTVDDAAAVAEHDVAVFADAAVRGAEPFALCEVEPEPEASFSTHSVSPGAVLQLARLCFRAGAKAYVLGIRGYAFNEFGERLSERAKENLAAAADFLEEVIRENRFAEAAAGPNTDFGLSEGQTCRTENM